MGAGPQQHHLHAAGTNTSFRSLGHNASSLGHHHHPGGGPPPGVAEGDEPLSPALAIVLLYGLMLLMVGAQAGLFYWKKRHKRSYELVTLVGLWVMPAIISLQLHFWRFIAVWACYSAVTGYLLYTCSGRQMATTTPRTVYGWFLGVFRISKLTGQIGYVLLITEMLGAKPLLDMILPQGASLIVLWYGLYFGILTRDCAEVASDQMAASLGTGGRRIVSTVNACGICGNELRDMSHITGAAAVAAGGAGGAAAAGETAAEKCVQVRRREEHTGAGAAWSSRILRCWFQSHAPPLSSSEAPPPLPPAATHRAAAVVQALLPRLVHQGLDDGRQEGHVPSVQREGGHASADDQQGVGHAEFDVVRKGKRRRV